MIAFIIAFALLSIPLSHLTFARVDKKPVVQDKAQNKAEEKVPTYIRVRLAHVPASLSIKVQGQELLSPEQQKPTATSISFEAELAIPAEGLEIIASATWPEGTPNTALTLDLEPSEKQNRSLTNWSKGNKLSPTSYLFLW
ncbi:hypothetical protein [Roseimicrobium gellanilyticum]|uniref:hypothetical protein n=1 Tax=Roseimicrobium gellanilyticum TaxID=748857 RepID=UPI000DEAAE5D|nr:hypothetical protein [Roseimicrobium gellanilyticum]